MTVLPVAAAALGLLAGLEVHRRAEAFRPRAEGADVVAPVRSAGSAGTRRLVSVGAVAMLFALAALRFGLSWELPAFLFFAAAAVLLAVVDLRYHLLPDRIVGPSVALSAVLLTVAAVGSGAWPALLRSAGAAPVLAVAYLALALISPRGLGMGDVKLALLLGLFLGWIGWGALVVGTIAAFVVQALLALLLLAGRRIGRRGELPFGPAMLAGAALAVAWGNEIAAAYVRSIGRT